MNRGKIRFPCKNRELTGAPIPLNCGVLFRFRGRGTGSVANATRHVEMRQRQSERQPPLRGVTASKTQLAYDIFEGIIRIARGIDRRLL